jgi:proline iminopeptidase
MNRFGLLRPLTIAFLALALAGCSQQVAQTPAPPPIEDGFVAMEDGTRLFYRKVGNGPQAVVLPADLYLHPTFDRLAPGRTLYYYDMRNRGLSDSVTADRANSIQQDVLDLEELRAHLGLESVDLVGYSYLGLMVVMYAKAHPAHVRRIVQLGPVPVRFGTEYPDGLRAPDYFAAMDSAGLAEVRRLREEGLHYSDPAEYCRRENEVTRIALVGNPEHVSRLNQDLCDKPNEWPTHLAGHFDRHFTSVQALNLNPSEFRDVTQPVLTVHGTLDRNAPYGSGREWAMTLPDAQLLTIEGAAHSSWAHDPDFVLGAIETFLNGAWPEQAEVVTTLERPASAD